MEERFELPGMMPVHERFPRLRRAIKSVLFVSVLGGLAGYGYQEYQEINKKDNHKAIVDEQPSDPLGLAGDILDESRHQREGEEQVPLPVLRGGIAVRSAGATNYSVKDPILIQLDSSYDNIIFVAGHDPIKKEPVIWQYDPEQTRFCKPEGEEAKIEMVSLDWNYSDNSFKDTTIGFLVKEIPKECQAPMKLPAVPTVTPR